MIQPFEEDEWNVLKTYTDARIALGRTGVSVPMRESLAFRLAHAHAKDAVYSELADLSGELTDAGFDCIRVRSRAGTRDEYLRRPDLGRILDPASAETLQPSGSPDILIIIADGLSASAVNENALPVLLRLREKTSERGLTLGPVVLAEQARVALADEIGSRLNARLTVILIGERPGLSSADSMGAYLTFAPQPGLTDERRNCISNIRRQGLIPDLAADKIMYLIEGAFRLGISGVALKDDSGGPPDGALISGV